MSTINATTTASTAITVTGDTTGNIELQNAGVTHYKQTTSQSQISYATGGATPPTALSGSILHIAGADASGGRVSIDAWGSPPILSGRRSGGTIATPTATTVGSALIQMTGSGYSTGYVATSQGSIAIVAAETWDATKLGTYVTISTTPIGSTTVAEVVRIDDVGRVGIGGTPAQPLDIMANNTGATANNTLRFTDTDTATQANQPMGKIEFYSSDVTAPTAGVKAYILGASEGTAPASYIAFATDQVTGTPVEAVRINSGGFLSYPQGADVASAAGTITPLANAPFFRVTGALAITGLNTTNIDTSKATQITIIPTGTFTWTTAGNIGLAGTAVVGKALTFTWMPTQSKWYPSYTA